MTSAGPTSVDDYIAACEPKAQVILRRIRSLVKRTAPKAEEVISYRMPAFKQGGILLYYAAFKAHIGLFPPVSGDARLQKALAKFAGPKGNLRLPLDEPMPYDLIARIVKLRLAQSGGGKAVKPAKAGKAKAASRKAPPPNPTKAATGRETRRVAR